MIRMHGERYSLLGTTKGFPKTGNGQQYTYANRTEDCIAVTVVYDKAPRSLKQCLVNYFLFIEPCRYKVKTPDARLELL